MVRIPLRVPPGHPPAHVLVDDEDYTFLSQWSWFWNRGYAIRRTTTKQRKSIDIRMHRVLVGLPRGDEREVDHLNGDRLDNRKENLRIVTKAQNAENKTFGWGSSVHRGVSRSKGGRWGVWCRGRYYGSYETEDEAAEAARQVRREVLPYSVN